MAEEDVVENEDGGLKKVEWFDNRNRAWTCKVTGFILYQFGGRISLDAFTRNEITLGEMMELIWLCQPKLSLKQRKASKEDFMNLLEGDVFEDAMEAAGNGLANFFRSPRDEKKEAEAKAKEEKERQELKELEESQKVTQETDHGTGDTGSV